MFETSEQIATMVDRLYEACRPLNRGDILARESISEVVGVDPNIAHWGHVVRKVRRRMERDRHISMMPVTGVGFQLCTIQEQIELAEYRQRRAARQIRRGERSLKTLESVKGLTVHQRRLRVASLDGLRKSRLKIAEEMRAIRVASRATPTLPRMKPVQPALIGA